MPRSLSFSTAVFSSNCHAALQCCVACHVSCIRRGSESLPEITRKTQTEQTIESESSLVGYPRAAVPPNDRGLVYPYVAAPEGSVDVSDYGPKAGPVSNRELRVTGSSMSATGTRDDPAAAPYTVGAEGHSCRSQPRRHLWQSHTPVNHHSDDSVGRFGYSLSSSSLSYTWMPKSSVEAPPSKIVSPCCIP